MIQQALRALLVAAALIVMTTADAWAQQFVVTPGRVITATLVLEDGRLVAHFPAITIHVQGCSTQSRCAALAIALDAESTNTAPMSLELHSGAQAAGPIAGHAAIVAPTDANGTATITGLNVYDTPGSARLLIGGTSFFVRLVVLPGALAPKDGARAQPVAPVAPLPAATAAQPRYATTPIADAVRHLTVEGTNAARFGPLAVQLTNANGTPGPANVDVTFSCVPVEKLSCYLGSLGAPSVHVKTDSHGVATLDLAFGRFVDPTIKEGQLLVTATGPEMKPSSFQLLISR